MRGCVSREDLRRPLTDAGRGARGGRQEMFQLAHEFELELENGPAPFWLYIILAVPGPLVAFLMLTDGFGPFGQRFPDGSSMPPEEEK